MSTKVTIVPSGRIPARLLGAVAAFQLALALGAPWGEASYGGAHIGVLPTDLRIGSAFAVLAYLALAAVVGTSWVRGAARRWTLTGGSVLMGAGAVMNFASPSLIERAIWTPVTVALAILLWKAARKGAHPTARTLPREATAPSTRG